jgi:Glycosyl transferase family 2
MGELTKIVVVVPTYNERENLPVLAGLLADLNLPGLELLVVDDSSPTAPVTSPTNWRRSRRRRSAYCTGR